MYGGLGEAQRLVCSVLAAASLGACGGAPEPRPTILTGGGRVAAS